jgi:hypothetical protein
VIILKDYKTIYLIGNGFDLHHKLKTKYSDFKMFLKEKDNNLVDLIDNVFFTRGYSKNEVEMWSTLEEMLEVLSYLDEDEIYQEAFDNSEWDMDRASYWHDPKFNADEKAKELLTPLMMKKYFDEWVESLNTGLVKKDWKLRLRKRSTYICFNYTDTLQKIYRISDEHVLHIHGRIGQEYILGHNGLEKLPYIGDLWNPYEDVDGNTTSDTDIREVEVKESINETYLRLFRSYSKNSAKIIQDNFYWFERFNSAKKVIIMGLSLGSEDIVYLQKLVEMVPKECRFKIYYHPSKDELIKNIGTLLDAFKVKFVKW